MIPHVFGKTNCWALFVNVLIDVVYVCNSTMLSTVEKLSPYLLDCKTSLKIYRR